MDLLENIKITNFRGFDEKGIEIDGLSKFNVFVGRNNCGKTSVLEAICLLASLRNPNVAVAMNSIRRIYNNNNDNSNLKCLFHNNVFNKKTNPKFIGNMCDNTERKLEIIPVSTSYPKNIDKTNLDTMVNSVMDAAVLESVYFSWHTKDKNGEFLEQGNNLEHEILMPILDMPLIYIPSSNLQGLLENNLFMLSKENSEHIVNRELNKFDRRIKSVHSMKDGIYCVIDGISEKVKIETLGDGVYRFLNVIVPVILKKCQYLCIDEIENGLHYTSQKLLLKSLLRFSESNNVQLFMTTHNIEILKNLKEVLEEDEMASMRDFTKIFDIVKAEKTDFKSYKYDFETFSHLIKTETEMRI